MDKDLDTFDEEAPLPREQDIDEGDTGSQASGSDADTVEDDDEKATFWDKTEEKDDGKFRLNARMLFGTASQCPIPPKYYLAFLRNKFKDTKWKVSREHHKDGNFHLHFMGLKNKGKKFNITSCKACDISWSEKPGIVPKEYHMSIGPVRVPQAALKYICKEGFEIVGDLTSADLPSDGTNYAEILHEIMECPKEQRTAKAYEVLARDDPKFFIQQHRNVEYFANKVGFGHEYEAPKVGPECNRDWKTIPTVEEWITDCKSRGLGRKKMLFMHGRTEYGKTNFIKARLIKEGKVSYMRGTFNLKKCSGIEYDFHIVDDIAWPPIGYKDRSDCSKSFLLAMGEMEVDDKMTAKKSIFTTAGCVYVCNELRAEAIKELKSWNEYWKHNVVEVEITEPTWIEDKPLPSAGDKRKRIEVPEIEYDSGPDF